jgi:hypothetical protein
VVTAVSASSKLAVASDEEGASCRACIALLLPRKSERVRHARYVRELASETTKIGGVIPEEIVPGLLRWSAPHPEWEPDAEPGSAEDWDPMVGSVIYEQPHAVTLIDPLLPPEDREGFLVWLDERVAGRPVSVLTTIRWHRRDRDLLAERYRSHGAGAWNAVPAGVSPKPLRGAGETMYWLAGVAALVPGDRIIGAEGALRLCPESWLRSVQVDRAGLAELMRPLLELPIERVLVSHGEVVLRDGRAKLAHALAEAGAGPG